MDQMILFDVSPTSTTPHALFAPSPTTDPPSTTTSPTSQEPSVDLNTRINLHNPYNPSSNTSTHHPNSRVTDTRISTTPSPTPTGPTTLQQTPHTLDDTTSPDPQNPIEDRAENVPWGDELDTPAPSSCRIYFSNIGGLSKQHDHIKSVETGEYLRSINAHIIGLAETNVNWKSRGIYKSIKRKLTTGWKQAFMTATNANPIPTRENHAYQPGGVLSLISGTWAGMVSANFTDTSSMGRWTIVHLRGRNNSVLAIITAYCPPVNHIDRAGPLTVFSQQWHHLRQTTCSNPDPRQQFYSDLQTTIHEQLQLTPNVLLMLDANETLDPRTPLSQFCSRNELFDCLQHQHSSTPPETCQKGNRTIDFILATRPVLECITRSGMTEYFLSDHRGLFVDLDYHALLGDKIPQSASPSGRGLRLRDKTRVAQYQDHLKNEILSHHIPQRLEMASQSTNVSQTLADIDHELTHIMLQAEKQFGSFEFSLPWSPELMKAKHRQRYWQLWYKDITTDRDCSRQRQKLNYTPPHPLPTAPSKAFVKLQLHHASQNLKNIIRQAHVRRDEYLHDLAEAEHKMNRKEKEKIIRQLRRYESDQLKWNNIKQATNAKQKGGLKEVTVVNPDGTVSTLTDGPSVEAALVSRNTNHFNQAHGTPITLLIPELGWHGTSARADDILNGNPPDIEHEALLDLLHLLRLPENIPSISSHFSASDIKARFRCWKERTTTSPSGRNLSLYKIMDHDRADLEDMPTQHHPSEIFFSVIANILNISFQHGIILPRWRTVTTVMIPKIPGNNSINKLRAIHIYESDINLALGLVLGKRLMSNAEKHDLLNPEQWGSRKGRCSEDTLFLKSITYAISTLTRTNLATFDNDAKSCYDRIVMLLAMLVARTMGAPKEACFMEAELMRTLQYQVQTQLGISNHHYGNATESPMYGSGQGSIPSPPIWCIISCLLMNAIQFKSPGIKFVSPDGSSVSHRWTDGFVDDVNLLVNDFEHELLHNTSTDLAPSLQLAAQWWEKFLDATGGKLELSKCFFYQLEWKFDQDGLPYPYSPPSQITLTDSTSGASNSIEQKTLDSTHKTLGLLLAPVIDSYDDSKRLIQKADDYDKKLRCSFLTSDETIQAYFSVFSGRIGTD